MHLKTQRHEPTYCSVIFIFISFHENLNIKFFVPIHKFDVTKEHKPFERMELLNGR